MLLSLTLLKILTYTKNNLQTSSKSKLRLLDKLFICLAIVLASL